QQVPWPKGAVRKTVDIALPRGVRMRGKVVDKTAGQPVDRVHVTFFPRQDNKAARRKDLLDFAPSVRSGADGAFELLVPAGPGHLLGNAPDTGFISQTVGSNELLTGKAGGYRKFFHAVAELDLKPEQEVKEVKLSLRRGVTLRGKLVGPDGKPVPRAVLFAPGELLAPPTDVRGLDVRPAGGQRARALLIRDGRFELHGCDPDR